MYIISSEGGKAPKKKQMVEEYEESQFDEDGDVNFGEEPSMRIKFCSPLSLFCFKLTFSFFVCVFLRICVLPFLAHWQ